MSERAIQVGDLVMVAKPTICCGRSTAMQGHIFTVTSIHPSKFSNFCKFCLGRVAEPMDVSGGATEVSLARIKRIPPLSELEAERTDAGVTA